jgi:hypothetical protein
MTCIRTLVLGGLLLAPALAYATDEEGRDAEQQTKKQKADEKAKEGALKEKKDPAADLKLQQQNVKRLRINAEENRKVGNRAATWAAEQDLRHAEKLVEKDKKLLDEHERK